MFGARRRDRVRDRVGAYERDAGEVALAS